MIPYQRIILNQIQRSSPREASGSLFEISMLTCDSNERLIDVWKKLNRLLVDLLKPTTFAPSFGYEGQRSKAPKLSYPNNCHRIGAQTLYFTRNARDTNAQYIFPFTGTLPLLIALRGRFHAPSKHIRSRSRMSRTNIDFLESVG